MQKHKNFLNPQAAFPVEAVAKLRSIAAKAGCDDLAKLAWASHSGDKDAPASSVVYAIGSGKKGKIDAPVEVLAAIRGFAAPFTSSPQRGSPVVPRIPGSTKAMPKAQLDTILRTNGYDHGWDKVSDDKGGDNEEPVGPEADEAEVAPVMRPATPSPKPAVRRSKPKRRGDDEEA